MLTRIPLWLGLESPAVDGRRRRLSREAKWHEASVSDDQLDIDETRSLSEHEYYEVTDGPESDATSEGLYIRFYLQRTISNALWWLLL